MEGDVNFLNNMTIEENFRIVFIICLLHKVGGRPQCGCEGQRTL